MADTALDDSNDRPQAVSSSRPSSGACPKTEHKKMLLFSGHGARYRPRLLAGPALSEMLLNRALSTATSCSIFRK